MSTPQGARPGVRVRQAFQHLLLFGLVVVTAIGTSGLLQAVLSTGSTAGHERELARAVSFTTVGAPLLLGVAWWTRRQVAHDPAELRSRAWLLFLAGTELLALAVAVFAAYDVLACLLDLRDFSEGALATTLVWGGAWLVLRQVGGRQADQLLLQPQRILGSVVGLAVTMLGLGVTVAATLRTWTGLDGGSVLVGRHEPALEGMATVALGALVWCAYWWRWVLGGHRTVRWYAHVLLVGVGAGLVVALAAGSLALHRVAVWFVGEPGGATAREHFASVPAYAASALVGLLSLAYHQGLVTERRERNDVDRVRDHLLAAIALGAAAVGGAALVAAFVDALTGPPLVSGTGPANTVLAASTLLLVGLPVWWVSWRRTRRAAAVDPTELTSTPRRLHLLTLLGLSSLAAVLALVVGAWLLVDAVLLDEPARAVLRTVRVPLGVLISAAVVAGYHWQVHLAGRDRVPAANRHLDFVLLLGVGDPDVADRLARATGATVWAWSRGADDLPWPEEDLMAALAGATVGEVVVLADPAATPTAARTLRVLPVHRPPNQR